MTLSGRTAHTSPQALGNISSFRLSKRRWHRDRSSHQFLHWKVELWNEGTPFRCFGPHTHRKAPVEAQARFSEESCNKNLQDRDYCSTAGRYRQARCNSRNLFSVATTARTVNRIRSTNHRVAVELPR